MRLSTVQIFQQGVNAILDQQSKLQQTEQQLATGKRVLSPSDDPIAAVQILDINEDLAAVDQHIRNADLAEGQLAQEENVLVQVGDVLQRVRELVVQANNGSQSPESRGSIAVEIEARLGELKDLANTRDAAGEYIFAGYQSSTQPFTEQGGVVSYHGDAGQRFAQLGAATQVAVRDSGDQVFMAIPSGNGRFATQPAVGNTGTAIIGKTSVNGSFIPGDYTVTFNQPAPTDPITYQVTDASAAVLAGGTYADNDTIAFNGVQMSFSGTPADGDSFGVAPSTSRDIFTTLQSIVTDLQNPNDDAASIAAVHNSMASALDNLDQGLGHVLEVRASIGARMGQVDSQRNLNADFNVQMQEALSNVQDVDFAEAVSKLNLQLTALQAAQQAYVKVQGLSLFSYM
jgi:flagellar hook-associated protein 3 FlgL